MRWPVGTRVEAAPRAVNRTAITRWLGATLLLVAVVWVDGRWGHAAASAVLVAALIAVALWGGHGRAAS